MSVLPGFYLMEIMWFLNAEAQTVLVNAGCMRMRPFFEQATGVA